MSFDFWPEIKDVKVNSKIIKFLFDIFDDHPNKMLM